MKNLTDPACELCSFAPEHLLWQDDFCRIVLVDDADYPGFCRVILHSHAKEMTDLDPCDRARLMNAVFSTEAALRAVANPDKINLASFGNAVPHLHWHVIPRWRDDRHFPKSVWAAPERPGAPRPGVQPAALASRLRASLGPGRS